MNSSSRKWLIWPLPMLNLTGKKGMVKAKERTKKIRRKIFRFSFGRISLRRRKIVRKTEKIEEIFQRILAALKLRKARGQRSSSEVGG